MKKRVSRKCFLVSVNYTDFETGERVQYEDYLKDLSSIVKYFQDFQEECVIVSADEFRNREDLQIKIKQVYIPDKKYVSLFN